MVLSQNHYSQLLWNKLEKSNKPIKKDKNAIFTHFCSLCPILGEQEFQKKAWLYFTVLYLMRRNKGNLKNRLWERKKRPILGSILGLLTPNCGHKTFSNKKQYEILFSTSGFLAFITKHQGHFWTNFEKKTVTILNLYWAHRTHCGSSFWPLFLQFWAISNLPQAPIYSTFGYFKNIVITLNEIW